MTTSYHQLTGLWAKSTKRGQVLSVRLTASVRRQIETALEQAEGHDAEIVVMPASSTHPKGPSHTLLVSLSIGAPTAAPEERER